MANEAEELRKIQEELKKVLNLKQTVDLCINLIDNKT